MPPHPAASSPRLQAGGPREGGWDGVAARPYSTDRTGEARRKEGGSLPPCTQHQRPLSTSSTTSCRRPLHRPLRPTCEDFVVFVAEAERGNGHDLAIGGGVGGGVCVGWGSVGGLGVGDWVGWGTGHAREAGDRRNWGNSPRVSAQATACAGTWTPSALPSCRPHTLHSRRPKAHRRTRLPAHLRDCAEAEHGWLAQTRHVVQAGGHVAQRVSYLAGGQGRGEGGAGRSEDEPQFAKTERVHCACTLPAACHLLVACPHHGCSASKSKSKQGCSEAQSNAAVSPQRRVAPPSAAPGPPSAPDDMRSPLATAAPCSESSPCDSGSASPPLPPLVA